MNKAMLANAAGITSNYLYRITGGYRSPSNVVAKKIADVLDVDVLDIFFEKDVSKSIT
ncbi:hypothetical protein FC87_GL000006 [Fructilactobacillus florum DSM 22689 = JCM 16035]|uniref:HTH cro/C1-type domain-containing protein n=2 Tax=Fructilactobacillus florum TaxID=640331 RepID=A0A0R2CM92_9LACO|nr:hypothetical protein FC87_GL000006 [Fructilactobacillus florum DSM 22689 = JCM 16035]